MVYIFHNSRAKNQKQSVQFCSWSHSGISKVSLQLLRQSCPTFNHYSLREPQSQRLQKCPGNIWPILTNQCLWKRQRTLMWRKYLCNEITSLHLFKTKIWIRDTRFVIRTCVKAFRNTCLIRRLMNIYQSLYALFAFYVQCHGLSASLESVSFMDINGWNYNYNVKQYVQYFFICLLYCIYHFIRNTCTPVCFRNNPIRQLCKNVLHVQVKHRKFNVQNEKKTNKEKMSQSLWLSSWKLLLVPDTLSCCCSLQNH